MRKHWQLLGLLFTLTFVGEYQEVCELCQVRMEGFVLQSSDPWWTAYCRTFPNNNLLKKFTFTFTALFCNPSLCRAPVKHTCVRDQAPVGMWMTQLCFPIFFSSCGLWLLFRSTEQICYLVFCHNQNQSINLYSLKRKMSPRQLLHIKIHFLTKSLFILHMHPQLCVHCFVLL